MQKRPTLRAHSEDSSAHVVHRFAAGGLAQLAVGCCLDAARGGRLTGTGNWVSGVSGADLRSKRLRRLLQVAAEEQSEQSRR